MRDQWRAGDDYRVSNRDKVKRTKDHRPLSPAAPRPEGDTELGLKIKGRAVADSAPTSPPRKRNSEREEGLKKATGREISRSPRRRRVKGEERAKRPREPSRGRYPEQPRRRDKSDYTSKRRRRTRSRSPAREIFDFREREERRRSRSPIYPGRSDNFRPSSRQRERAVSPPRSIRGDYYSSSYPEESRPVGRFADSYVPGTRRRPTPPVANHSHRRRSRSSDRYPKPRRASPHPRHSSPDRVPTRTRESKASLYRPSPPPRDSSKRQGLSDRRRKSSPSRSRRSSKGPSRGHKSSRSPAERKGRNRGPKNMQQSPTRPIQSILDNGSRPPSPPRRIPSYESGHQGQSVNLNEAFPMHGMKANDLHGTHRPNRPPHLNTQTSYHASPQWTPTSSHHGSPHSGSPFSQGRGGWNGQQQQYQNQHK